MRILYFASDIMRTITKGTVSPTVYNQLLLELQYQLLQLKELFQVDQVVISLYTSDYKEYLFHFLRLLEQHVLTDELVLGDQYCFEGCYNNSLEYLRDTGALFRPFEIANQTHQFHQLGHTVVGTIYCDDNTNADEASVLQDAVAQGLAITIIPKGYGQLDFMDNCMMVPNDHIEGLLVGLKHLQSFPYVLVVDEDLKKL